MLIFQGGRVQDNWEKPFPYYLGLSILAFLLGRTLDLCLPLFRPVNIKNEHCSRAMDSFYSGISPLRGDLMPELNVHGSEFKENQSIILIDTNMLELGIVYSACILVQP